MRVQHLCSGTADLRTSRPESGQATDPSLQFFAVRICFHVFSFFALVPSCSEHLFALDHFFLESSLCSSPLVCVCMCVCVCVVVCIYTYITLHYITLHCVTLHHITLHYNTITSSTAQGGGGSFKNRKPIGEVGCCESGMAERSHWLTERWLELCLLEWLQFLQRSPHSQLLDVVWCTATVVVVVA